MPTAFASTGERLDIRKVGNERRKRGTWERNPDGLEKHPRDMNIFEGTSYAD